MNFHSNLSHLLRAGLNEIKDNNYVEIKELGSWIPLVIHQSYPQKNLPAEIKKTSIN